MSRKEDRLGGPPGSLKRWLFGLRLPPTEHRVLELMVESANPLDGFSWDSIAWIAYNARLSEETVMRAIRRLEQWTEGNEEPVLRVFRAKRGGSLYQLRCHDLPKLADTSRLPDRFLPRLTGVDLTPVAATPVIPRETGDDLTPETDRTDGELPPAQVSNCQTEVPQGSSPGTAEVPQEGTACAATSAAPAPGSAAASPEHVHNPECECHPNPHRPKLDGVRDDSPAVVLVPLVGGDGRPFALTEGLLGRLGRDYPGVDAEQAARNIRNWCLANPRRRKTPGGVAAFVTAWFGREQDRASRGHAPSRSGAAPATRTADNVAAAAAFARGEVP